MAALRIFVECNDLNLWALKPFAYLFNMYWSQLQAVVVCGYNRPEYPLPPNFEFYSISDTNFPAERWSDGFIQFLKDQSDKHFALFLADYWLCRTVDVRGVAAAHDYVQFRPNVLRIDLTADRLYAGGMFDLESYGCYDIIETPKETPYQFSLQTGIWNRELLLSILQPKRSPWEVETDTQVPDSMRVLGMRQFPVRYANGVLKGMLDMAEINRIPEDHRRHVMNMIPEDMLKKISPRTITEVGDD